MTTTKLGVMPEDIDLFAEISRHNQENNIQTYHLKKNISLLLIVEFAASIYSQNQNSRCMKATTIL